METAKHVWEKSHPLADATGTESINGGTSDSYDGAREGQSDSDVK